MPQSVTREMTVTRLCSTEKRVRPVAASQTIKRGDIVIASDSNGRVAQAVAAGNNIGAAGANNRLAVFASADVSSTVVDTAVEAEFVAERSVLRMPLCSGDSAQAWSIAYLNKRYEIRRKSTSGEYVVDISANTNSKVEVIGVDEATKNDTAPFVFVRPINDGSWAQ